MTYRNLIKELGRLTEDQLDGHIMVELENTVHNVAGINIGVECVVALRSSKGNYLYKDEVFFSIDLEPLDKKEEEEV